MEPLDRAYPALLNFTNRNLRRFATERLRRAPHRLTVDQWGVLRLLEEAGGELTIAEVANRLLKDKPTLTRILDLLVGAQLVTREADPADRRRAKLRLTPQGRRRVERAAVLVEEMRREMSRGLTPQDRADLERILSKINENIEAARARRWSGSGSADGLRPNGASPTRSARRSSTRSPGPANVK